jgi:hypothetical protein
MKDVLHFKFHLQYPLLWGSSYKMLIDIGIDASGFMALLTDTS